MKKFMVLYYAPQEAQKQMADASPEDMKKGMEPWMKWQEKLGSALLDMGSPLGNAHEVTKEGLSDSDSQVAGFSVIQADSIEATEDMLKDHPHLGWMEEARIEVFEYFPLPGLE